jgi:hypothetical protein
MLCDYELLSNFAIDSVCSPRLPSMLAEDTACSLTNSRLARQLLLTAY